MYQDVLIDPRKMIVYQFLYTVIPLETPGPQVLKWVPMEESKIISLSNGDHASYIRALILNSAETYITNLPLLMLGITLHPINSNLTFTGMESADTVYKSLIAGRGNDLIARLRTLASQGVTSSTIS